MEKVNITYKNTSCRVAIPDGAEELVAAAMVKKVYPNSFGTDFFKQEVETLAKEIRSMYEPR